MIEYEKKIAQQTLNILKKKSWNTFSLEQVLKNAKLKKTYIKTKFDLLKLISKYVDNLLIDKTKSDNCIHAKVNNASFVGNSYQYILNSNVGKLYVVSGETNNVFNVGEEVFLSIDEKEVKVLNDQINLYYY